jgi:uncharacterized RDD family membrane protein YckC
MEVWIGRDGERHGPYREEDIRQWLRSGQVSHEDLGWYEGLADWQPLAVLFPDAVPAAAVPSAASSVPPLPHTTATTLHDYAGFWKRVAAYILDVIVLYLPTMLIQKMMGGTAAENALQQALLSASGDPSVMLAAEHQYYAAMWPAMLLTTVLAWLYFAACESSTWQATVGKMALGIRVTDLQGRRISFPRALGRYAAKFVSFLILFIGVLMVAWTQRKQGLHDMLANTLVLNGRASDFRSGGQPDDRGSFHA